MVLLEGGGASLREVLSLASQPEQADVTLVCQGGSINTSTFLLRMIRSSITAVWVSSMNYDGPIIRYWYSMFHVLFQTEY